MGCGDYDPLLRNRRQRLGELRMALGTSLPPHAHAKINRMLDRPDLVRTQIAELEQDRDAVLQEKIPDKAGEMIQQLAKLRGIARSIAIA
jgi:transposase